MEINLYWASRFAAPSIPGLSERDLNLAHAWFHIRDLLFGRNWVSRDLNEALRQTKTCEHPDAKWLASVVLDKGVHSQEKLMELLKTVDDVRARSFVALFDGSRDAVVEAANQGYGFALALGASWTHGPERMRYAEAAALQFERDGFDWLGDCLLDGDGCKKDVDRAIQMYKFGAKLGNGASAFSLSRVATYSMERWFWLSEAAKLANASPFLQYFPNEVSFVDMFHFLFFKIINQIRFKAFCKASAAVVLLSF